MSQLTLNCEAHTGQTLDSNVLQTFNFISEAAHSHAVRHTGAVRHWNIQVGGDL